MEEKGNMLLAVFVGFILMAVIGWIPVVGSLIAGFVAGILAKGKWRGLVAGFLAGIIGLILIVILGTAIGAAFGGARGALIGGAIGGVAGGILGILEFSGIILAAIGGFVGGAIKENEQVTKKQKPDKDDDNEDYIKTLKRRYAKGEITKKQYDKMRKELES